MHLKDIEEYFVTQEPFYLPTGKEVDIFGKAWELKLPVLLKGPTGCGKTRFVEYMAFKVKRPLVTVACHDDLTAADLVGRYHIKGGDTVWMDGPLTRAARSGALCYLDEIVEARKDTTVVIHPLADERRLLPVEKLGKILRAAEGFMLIISYNPGYQSVVKDLKPSTRQRFVTIEFSYPAEGLEAEIVSRESGVDRETARLLVKVGTMTRNLKEKGLVEGASTRLLIHAAKLVSMGVGPAEACRFAITGTLTDDRDMEAAIDEIIRAVF